VLAALGGAVPPAACADQQRDPQLQAVVAKAIGRRNASPTSTTPRLVHAHGAAARRIVKAKDERLDILKQVYCETHRAGKARLPPGLVMAVIDVESRFDRWRYRARARGSHAG